MNLFFQHTWLDGQRKDVRVRKGYITEIGELTPTTNEQLIEGGSLTPPLAEPHVHLDAGLLGAQAPNRSGTLREGIANWASLRPMLTHKDVFKRAQRVCEMYASYGTSRIRTHVDTGSLTAVQALLDLRQQLAGQIELEIVAFPQEGILRAPGRKERWIEAIAMGCDAVGAIPHFERTTEEGWDSVRLAFDLAEKYGKKLDFHCDETDDPGSRNLELVCAQSIDRGFFGRVVAGHCTAMHSYPNPYAAKIIELVTTAGVQVVANPLDNVVLQGRYDEYPRRRGLTRVDQLWRAGARVGIGHDSVNDPWYPLGTANLVDAAYMLVHLGHLTAQDEMERAVRTLSHENHLPFGEPPAIVEGSSANLVWWPAEDLIDVLRLRPKPRVFREGKER